MTIDFSGPRDGGHGMYVFFHKGAWGTWATYVVADNLEDAREKDRQSRV